MMKKIIILIGFTFSVLFSQVTMIKHADDHFKQLEYYRAAEIYEYVAKKQLKKSSNINWDYIRKTAYSYKQLHKTHKSYFYYTKLANANQLKDDDYLPYIDVLRKLNRHEDSWKYVEEYSKIDPTNRLCNDLLSNKKYIEHLKEDSDRYTITILPFNSGHGDFSPVIYNDGIVFASKRINSGFTNRKYGWDNENYIDLYYVEGSGKNFKKNARYLKQTFTTRHHDGPVFFSADGNTKYISRNDVTKKNDKNHLLKVMLYISKLENGKWTIPQSFKYNSTEYNLGHACVTKDNQTMYFASDMPGGYGGVDLYKSIFSNGEWSEPLNLGKFINTDGDEMFPYISENNVLFFSSTGRLGFGGLDIFSSTMDENGSFTLAENMGYPLNTSNDDFGLILYDFDKKGYFTSNREEDIDNIYAIEIKEILFELDGTVHNSDNKDLLANADVEVINRTTGEITIFKTDSTGSFKTKLKKNCDYEIKAKKDDYELIKTEIISTQNSKSSKIPLDLLLKPMFVKVDILVTEKGTGEVLPNTTGIIKDDISGKEYTFTSDENGKASIKIERDKNFDLSASKKGYIDCSLNFSTEKDLFLNIELAKLKKGDSFKVENIFYDYAKATLRPESMSSLDKLAEFIIKNNIKVELSSHTDSRGSDADNQKLSQRRAQSCVDYLIMKGVPSSNIVAKGYGESKLTNNCGNGIKCTEEQHQDNRRTEVKILEFRN